MTENDNDYSTRLFAKLRENDMSVWEHPSAVESYENLVVDITGTMVLRVGDRIVWASKAPRDNPHPRVGIITKINQEKKTVTARADLPESDRGASSTVPASRVMRVLSHPALGHELIKA